MRELFTTTSPTRLTEHMRRQGYRFTAEASSYLIAASTGSYFAQSIIENGPLPIKIALGAATTIFLAGGGAMHRIRNRAQKSWSSAHPQDLPL